MDLRIETTSEEIEGLRIVRDICSTVVDPIRLTERDSKTHFDIVLDQDALKSIMRLHFFGGNKKVEFLDGVDPVLIDLASVSDLHEYGERICDALKKQLSAK
jgi:hypothetical protein